MAQQRAIPYDNALPALREAPLTGSPRKPSKHKVDDDSSSENGLAIAFVVFMVVVAATFYLLGRVHLREAANGSGFVYQFVGGLSLLAAINAALLLHEGGHAIAARLVGLKVQLVQAGAFVFDRREDGRLRPRLGLMTLSGVTYSTLRSWTGVERFRRSFRTSVAGGPIGSVVGFLGGVATLVIVARVAGANQPRWAGFVEVGSLISLYLAVMNLVPKRNKAGLYSDGAQLKRWRPFVADSVAERPWIPIVAAAHFSIERRPQEWDAEIVRLLESSTADPELGGFAAAFLAFRALDVGEPALAGKWLQHAIDQHQLRSGEELNAAGLHVALAATIYEGAWRRDADAARRWIMISRSATPREAWLHQVAVAALHWADGKPWHVDRASRELRRIQAASPIPISAPLLHTTLERLTANG